MPIASATGVLSIGLLYVVTTLVGLLNMIFDVGALSYVPHLVDRRHLSQANSRLQASNAVAGISGPGLAGLLIGLITAPITLSVDAVSYLASALGLIAITRREPEPERPAERQSVGRSIAEGLRAVYGSRLLRALLTQSAALNLFFGAVITVFVVYAVRYLHLTPFKLGLVLGASAVGALTGALFSTRIRMRLGLGRSMVVNTIGLSAAPLLMIIPRGAGLGSMIILICSHLLYGSNVSMFNVTAITMRQTVTPRRVLARMNATYRMLLFGAPLFGALMGGLLGDALGLRPALIISLIAMTSPVLWIAFSPVFRLREMPSGPPPEPGPRPPRNPPGRWGSAHAGAASRAGRAAAARPGGHRGRADPAPHGRAGRSAAAVLRAGAAVVPGPVRARPADLQHRARAAAVRPAGRRRPGSRADRPGRPARGPADPAGHREGGHPVQVIGSARPGHRGAGRPVRSWRRARGRPRCASWPTPRRRGRSTWPPGRCCGPGWSGSARPGTCC